MHSLQKSDHERRIPASEEYRARNTSEIVPTDNVMTPGLQKRFLSTLTITVALGLFSAPGSSPAVEKAAEKPAFSATESIDEEAEPEDAQEDGSKALQDRYMHLDLKNIKPLSPEEEETLLGNWGDSEAEDGD